MTWKGPVRDGGFAFAILSLGMVFLASQVAAEGRRGPDSPQDQATEEQLVLRHSSAAKAVQPFVDRLLASGFFRNNETVRQEILDNEYVFFEGESDKAAKKMGILAYFSQGPAGKDRIFLRKDLFAHFRFQAASGMEPPGVGFEGPSPRSDLKGSAGQAPQDRQAWGAGMEDRRNSRNVDLAVLPILAHEICHDLWADALDQSERAGFARDAERLIEDYGMALTAREREFFLMSVGDDKPGPGRFGGYSGLGRMLASRVPSTIYGQELFAWLAERLFRMKARIPRPMRKYYAGLIAGVQPGP